MSLKSDDTEDNSNNRCKVVSCLKCRTDRKRCLYNGVPLKDPDKWNGKACDKCAELVDKQRLKTPSFEGEREQLEFKCATQRPGKKQKMKTRKGIRNKKGPTNSTPMGDASYFSNFQIEQDFQGQFPDQVTSFNFENNGPANPMAQVSSISPVVPSGSGDFEPQEQFSTSGFPLNPARELGFDSQTLAQEVVEQGAVIDPSAQNSEGGKFPLNEWFRQQISTEESISFSDGNAWMQNNANDFSQLGDDVPGEVPACAVSETSRRLKRPRDLDGSTSRRTTKRVKKDCYSLRSVVENLHNQNVDSHDSFNMTGKVADMLTDYLLTVEGERVFLAGNQLQGKRSIERGIESMLGSLEKLSRIVFKTCQRLQQQYGIDSPQSESQDENIADDVQTFNPKSSSASRPKGKSSGSLPQTKLLPKNEGHIEKRYATWEESFLDPNSGVDASGNNGIHLAVYHEKAAEFASMLLQDSWRERLEERNDYGEDVLTIAAGKKNSIFLRGILETRSVFLRGILETRSVNPNGDPKGRKITPLHRAIECELVDNVNLLCMYGAYPNVAGSGRSDSPEESPTEFARRIGARKEIRDMLEGGILTRFDNLTPQRGFLSGTGHGGTS